MVAESLTNAAKHAQATEVTVTMDAAEDTLHLVVSDDGVVGATSGTGSGLIGLKDRVAALGGQLTVVSPIGGGYVVERHGPAAPDTNCACGVGV
jgi:signal transduction histidine kinase